MKKTEGSAFVQRAIELLVVSLTYFVGQTQCVSDTIKLNCGNTPLYFERQCYDTGQQFAFVHIHENETTALQAAVWLMDSVRQGSVITWHGQQDRFINFSVGFRDFHFDPNRIYTEAGIRLTIGPTATDTAFLLVKAVADTFLQQYILGKNLIVAVHNNTDKGSLSINSYAKGGIYFKDAKAVYNNPLQDADDFFFTTEESCFRYLKDRSYNVVLQNNELVTDDGSLSVYCANHGICYINIEAQNAHFKQQLNMLSTVWDLIRLEVQSSFGINATLEQN